jgi:hypothetical protein
MLTTNKAHTLRLGPAFKWTDDTELKFIGHPDFNDAIKDARGDWELGEIPASIEKWAPGEMKGAEEFTHAFRPGETKSGRVILQWISSMMKGSYSRQGLVPNKALLEALLKGGGQGGVDVDGEDGVETLRHVVLECAKNHPRLSEKECLSMLEKYGSIDDNSSVESLEDDE